MNKKQISLSLLALILVASITLVIGLNQPIKLNPEQETISPNENNIEIVETLGALAGLQANDITITNNPVGISGEFIAPQASILNGLNYFLETSNNEKISDVELSFNQDLLSLSVEYQLNKFIKLPLALTIKPSLTSNQDLLISVEEVKLLDLTLFDWLVDLSINTFLKDFFSKDSNLIVEISNSQILLSKENFKGINLEALSLKDDIFKLELFIDLEYLLGYPQ